MRVFFITTACALVLPVISFAFPPAPFHGLFGTVQDEFGNPISGDDAEVLLETRSVVQTRSGVGKYGEAGFYYLKVPMDDGVTEASYQQGSMINGMPFLIRVKVGSRIYLPIEMIGDLSKIGKPGQETYLRLTLGEDKDGDGLPDAWEKAQGIGDLKPNDDNDRDGLTNFDEYISGTTPIDSSDGLRLEVVGTGKKHSTVEFFAVRGRTYNIHRSVDLKKWIKVPFLVNGDNEEVTMYRSKKHEKIIVRVPNSNIKPSSGFLRLMVE